MNLAEKLKIAVGSPPEKHAAALRDQSSFKSGAHVWTGLGTHRFL